MNKLTRTLRTLQTLRACFSQVTKTSSSAPVRRDRLQFSKERLVDFGELPHGEIPEALRALRPTEVQKLSNEIRVGTETYIGGQPAYLFINSALRCLSKPEAGNKLWPTAQLLLSLHMELSVGLLNTPKIRLKNL